MFKTINSLFVTMFGIGKLPRIPGSYASLVTVIFLYIIFHLLHISANTFLFFLVAIFIISLFAVNLFIKDLIRDMIMILITMIGFYTIIKNYNYLITKITCLLLLLLFMVYQITLYEIGI